MKRLALALFFTLGVCAVVEVSAHIKVRQKRAWIIDSFSIVEESPGPFPYSLGPIELDRNYLVHFHLRGRGVDEDPKGILSIDQKSGEVFVHKKVDYEQYHILKLTFEAKNASNNKVDTRLGVEVKILDINDNAPVFKPPNYDIDVEESMAQGQQVARVMAEDYDDTDTPNGTFSFRLVSVTPKTENAEFFIEQLDNTLGCIYFRGCLDYEKASKYTILVEAKDHGPKVQLSSTSTVIVKVIDKNNHPPEITGHTGPGKIKERESGVEVLRLQVTDRDSKGSEAWRAKYTIHGDKENYFKIETDPKTNEGILTVIKAMDYEEQTSRNISISVDNLTPYFSCEVTARPAARLWSVKTTTDTSSTGQPNLPKLYPTTITVQDVNDPPEFIPRVTKVIIWENEKEGYPLTTLKATDPDKSYASKFHFAKGEDVDNWISVDSNTGKVVLAKVPDRESTFVKNNTYSVILHVVDNGQPPLTGTGTLVIHVRDQNDNLPVLVENNLQFCLSDEPTMKNITAVDKDQPPYSDPFRFELLGDVKGKWRIEPNHGTTVNLIKESTVYSGVHELQVKISDSQGMFLTQNLSIFVCDCAATPNCHIRRFTGGRVGIGASAIITFACLLLIAMLLMALWMSCKEEKKMIPTDDPGSSLLPFNTETPGSDCKVPLPVTQVEYTHDREKIPEKVTHNGFSAQNSMYQKFAQQSAVETSLYYGQVQRRSLRRSSTRRSYKQSNRYQMVTSESTDFLHLQQTLAKTITQIMGQLEAPGEELGDYEPHCYAYEGEASTDPQLDAISIPEPDFHPDILTNLDTRFNKLASICRPDLMS